MSHSEHPANSSPSMKKPLMATFYGLTGLVFIFGLMALIFILLDAINSSRPAPILPQLEPTAEEKVQLQAYPKRDRLAMENEAKLRLESYGWADRAKNLAHIPLDRAMELALKSDWPVRNEPEELTSKKRKSDTP